MSKKQEFLNYVNEMINNYPENKMNDEAYDFWLALNANNEKEKPKFTDNGKLILNFLQTHQEKTNWKSKDIGEELFVSSRTVAGSIRKLVTDGYVEKLGESPALYSITEKGKMINLNDNEGE